MFLFLLNRRLHYRAFLFPVCVQKSAGGVLLPNSAVKMERYLMGEVLSVGAEVKEVDTGKKVLYLI
ncbi:10 kDa chaperonin 2, chloroplastic [Orobanche minor]